MSDVVLDGTFDLAVQSRMNSDSGAKGIIAPHPRARVSVIMRFNKQLAIIAADGSALASHSE